METTRRRFLTNVTLAGASASVASTEKAVAGDAERITTPQPATPPQARPGVHSLLASDHPYIFVDACMQMWPDADFASAHRHGVTTYAVTAWNPNADLDQALDGFMYWHLIATQYPNLIVVQAAEEIRRARREGKAGLLLAAQNGDWIGKKLHRVEAFKRLGLRMMLLAYSRSNQICDGCLNRTDGGLTRFGQLVVDECNRVSIVLDGSYVGKRATLDIIDCSAHPCVFSHSNPSALVPNPRNIDDEQIKSCAARGGVIGLVTWGPLAMKPGTTARPTVDDFIDHIDHAAQLDGGTDHIGISTDMSIGTYPDHERDRWGEPGHSNISERYDTYVTVGIRSPVRNVKGFSD